MEKTVPVKHPDPPGKTFDYFDGVMRNCYEWEVPHHISANCLIRISEVKERKTPLNGLLYELNFRVTGQVSVILDGLMVFENIPGAPMVILSPAISFSVGPNNSTSIEIDVVIVQALYKQEERETGEYKNRPSPYKGFPGERRGEPCVHPAFSDSALGPRPPLKSITLFKEDFERLNKKNSLGNNGWRTKREKTGSGKLFYIIPLFKEDFERYKQGDLPVNSGWDG